jgi:hypothetical protein
MMRFIRFLAPVCLLLALLAPGLSGLAQPVARATPAPALQLRANAVLADTSSSMTVQGSNFTRWSTVTLRLDNAATVGSVRAGSRGAFTVTVDIPGTAAGQHILTATDSANRSASASLYMVRLTLSPSRAPSGMQVTISGSSFLASQSTTVRLGARTIVSSTTDSSGAFQDTFMVPSSLSGSQVLVLHQGPSMALVLHDTFTITRPALTIRPATAGIGQTIVISGTGFAPEWDHELRLDNQRISALHTNGDGAFGPISFTIPSGTTEGRHEISLSTSAGHTVSSAILAINVAAVTLTLSPSTGVAGADVQVSGTGYQPGETVNIAAGAALLAAPTANVSGQVSVPVTLPRTLAAGTVTLEATGQTSHRTAVATYTIPLPSLSLSHSSVQAGASIIVTGHNFAAQEEVALTLGSTSLATARADASGSFSTSVTIPASQPAGASEIVVSGQSSQQVLRASLAIDAVTRIVLNTSTVQEGGTLSVTGAGFGPGEPVVLSIPDFTLQTVTATAQGEFSTSVSMPVTAPVSQVTLTASGQQTQRTASAGLTVTPLAAHLTLSAGSLVKGATFQVSGTGFRASEQVQIIVSGHILTTTTTNEKGEFSNVTVTLPSDVGPGAFTVSANGLHSQKTATASLSITVVPRISLNTSTAQESSTVTVTGAGFGPGEYVALSIPGFTLQTVVASAQGEFSASVTIPVTAPLSQVTMTAIGQQTQRTASAALTVTQLPARLTLSTSWLATGSTFQVSGSGFRAGEQVQITIVGRILSTLTTSNRGDFGNASVTLPADVGPGAFTISAMGLQSQKLANASLSITVAPRISLNTTIAQEGSTITVTGIGYGPGEPVVLSSPGFTLQTVTANWQGGFSTAVTIPVTAPISQVTLSATGQYTQRTAAAALTVTPLPARLTLSSSLLVVGASLQVSGSGFRPGEPVQISVPGHILATPTASNTGEFTNVTLTLPSDLGPGAFTINASGLHSQKTASASLAITVAPRISLNTSTVQEGSALTITGVGYGPGESVVLSIPGFTLHTVPANAQGEFSTSVTMPVTAPVSQVTLTATGQQTQRTASAALSVTQLPARLSLSTSWVVEGASFQVSAGGFRAGEPVQITIAGHVLATLTTNSKGEISNATLTLPASVGPGTPTIGASGLQSQKTAGAGLTVIARNASLSITPSTVTPGTPVRIEGRSFLPGERVDLLLNSSLITTVRASADGSFVLTTTLPPTLSPGSHRITASGVLTHLVATADVQLTAPAPQRVGSTTWYLASGRTDSGFSQQVDVLNTNTSPVHGTITFFYGANQTKEYPFTLRAQARGTYDAASILGVGTRFATMVQADLPIGVAQTSQRGADAMTGSTGVSTPSRTWYMAEGYTGLTFQEELDLLNPGSQAASVHIVWPLFNGKAPVVHDVVMAPRSHLTIPVNSYVDRASHATVVTADQPIVASRTILFGAYQQGAHGTAGATQADTTLYFAEGSTSSGFEEYLTILNPQSMQAAQVTATFYDRQGTLLGTRVIVVDPMHRANIKVNEMVRNSAIATVLRSTLPIVAERSMYFGAPNGGSADGTVVFGRATPALGWAFASGDTRSGRSEFELLFNPNGTSSTIVATFYGEDGRMLQRTFTLAGHSRLNIDVTLSVPELVCGLHGVVLQSTNGVSFVAEQALYANFMRSGSATLGTPFA